MEARSVLDILTMFENANIDVWVEGGWGVDALLGVQHRDHGDLDLVIDSAHDEATVRLLAENGFEVIFEDPPGRAAYLRGDQIIDVCVTAGDRYGDRWNLNRRIGRGEPDYPMDCFTYGWIGGRKVACLGPATQVAHHLGYQIEDVDTFDVGLLRDRFDVSVPESLR